MSLFGNLSQPAGQSVFGAGNNAGNNAAATGGGGLFGQSQSQPSAFGQSNTGGGMFANTQNQQQQLQQPQQIAGFGLGQSQMASSQQQQFGSSLWQPGSMTPQTKPVPEQMKAVADKWDVNSPNCVFKTYLYNKVDEAAVPHYRPGPLEDPKDWEEALQNKPAPNYIPVLCPGFPGIIARLMLQRRALTEFNSKLHEINACLDAILSRHDLEHSVRALAARRRHDVLRKRALALAARVQVMRNRGYALSSDEDELKQKLETLDRATQDPALTSRMEELWSRLILVRGYANNLKREMDRHGLDEKEVLNEEVEAKAKKILEDYEKQLQHLKKELGQIQKDLEMWQKDHQPAPTPR